MNEYITSDDNLINLFMNDQAALNLIDCIDYFLEAEFQGEIELTPDAKTNLQSVVDVLIDSI